MKAPKQKLKKVSAPLGSTLRHGEGTERAEAARILGRKGGLARVSKQTAEQRRESASRAAKARWLQTREGAAA